LRLDRGLGNAIKALFGRAVIVSLDAWFCFSSVTDKENALVLLLNGQQLFIFCCRLLKLS